MNIGTVIELDWVEQNLAKVLAKMRHDNNRASGVKNSKIGSQSNEVTDLEGIASELAFCRGFNCYPDLTIAPRSSAKGEDKGDLRLANGLIVDVKATKYSNGKLLAVTWKNHCVHAFALMVGEFPRYTFKGFMLQDDLINPKRIGDLGYGKTYLAEQHELVDMPKIIAHFAIKT